MQQTVTAILVARDGGEWLEETLAGLSAQTFAPTSVVAVNAGGSEAVSERLLAFGADRVIALRGRFSFGAAVKAAVQSLGEGAGRNWFWLLSEDSCPEPDALRYLFERVERAPSVVVAGPKLVDWDHPERIAELGQSLTRFGARWTLRRQELDQQQYDHLQDVLAVGPVGQLVREDVWRQLDGFDPALPVYDDGLDFCVRARLAGHRVEATPASRVRFAFSGVAGPEIDRKRSVLRRAAAQARVAQLHRRIVYAPAFVAWLAWLFLPLYGVGRVAWALLREQPGNMLGEFYAAYKVFFSPGKIVRARRNIKSVNVVGWQALRPLRVDPRDVRTARIIDREAILAATGRARRELQFISKGGVPTLLVAVLVGVFLGWWALGKDSLYGGAAAPLNGFARLWWNTRPLDGDPPDPFTWVLAVLGSITPWNPSYAIILLLVFVVPVAALGAWVWAARFTGRPIARSLAAFAYALAPTLLVSLSDGRVATVVVAAVLPWLAVTATRAYDSWSAAGAASLLAGIVLAAAPSLLPAGIVLLLVALARSARGFGRVLSIVIVPAVLFVPKFFAALFTGSPVSAFLDVLSDPGIVLPYEPGTVWHQLLGFPQFALHGWGDIIQNLTGGAGESPLPVTLTVGIALAPLALLGIVGAFTGRIRHTLPLALTGALGIATALFSARMHLLPFADESVSLWVGSGLILYWFALVTLASRGLTALARAASPVAALTLAGIAVAVLPVAVSLAGAQTQLREGETQLPALVRAAAESTPGLQTLHLRALDSQALQAQLSDGEGLRLDALRTSTMEPRVTEADKNIAQLVAELMNVTDLSAGQLQKQKVAFVLLHPSGGQAREQIQRLLDQNGALESAGVTAQGLLWRVPAVSEARAAAGSERVLEQKEDAADALKRLDGTELSGNAVWAIQLAVLFGVFLLALPTGEVVERPEKRRKPGKVRARRAAHKAKRSAVAAAAGAIGSTVAVQDSLPAGTSVAGSSTEQAATPGELSDAGQGVSDPDGTCPGGEPERLEDSQGTPSAKEEGA